MPPLCLGRVLEKYLIKVKNCVIIDIILLKLSFINKQMAQSLVKTAALCFLACYIK